MLAMIVLLILGSVSLLQAGQVSPTAPLKDLKQIQILSTVISHPKNVKDPEAAAIVEKALRRAILANEFQAVESAPVKARISLDEFSGGSFAKRFVIGYGAGRSTVDCQLQLLDQGEKEITSVRVRIRGDMAWGGVSGQCDPNQTGGEQV